MNGTNMDSQVCDVIIIGGGAAGLFAAYELANRDFDGSILMLEQGRELEDRQRRTSYSSMVFEDINDLIHGIGGAGLFLDSKLCLDPVGVKIKLDGDIISYIDSVFLKFVGNTFKLRNPCMFVLEDKEQFIRDANLEVYTYPVRFLGSDGGREFISKMQSYLLERGVEVRSMVRAIGVDKNNLFNVTTISDSGGVEEYHCKYLVIGVGAAGFAWIQRKLHPLGISGIQNPTYIGIRLEFSENVGKRIYEISDNPKIKLSRRSFCVKTHCFCYRGYVISYRAKRGVLVDGHANSTRDGTNSNMNILSKIDSAIAKDSTSFSWDIIDLCNKVGSGRPVLQRYIDFKRGDFTNRIGYVEPSLESYCLSNINIAYPRLVCNMLIECIEKLDIIFPGIADDDNLVYAPTLQWGIARMDVNRDMETNVSNLYLVGDCAGITQGIVSAAATGILAARSIVDKNKTLR